ncbi:MAG: class I SAM-dependent methyltransferase [Epsilonproteobacteria bacterium]|nr:class I SAM-dependent methyltransferase [Campylobacterota bacterium]
MAHKKTDTNADMSHQNGVRYKFNEFIESLFKYGFITTFLKIKQRVFYRLKGIDFSTQNIFDLTRVGEHQDHGTALVSTSKNFLFTVLNSLEKKVDHKIDKRLFVDIGSGKGAALIHAHNYGFKQSIGIEFAKELHEVACKNIEAAKVSNTISILNDATEYQFSKDTSIIFMFNPFDSVVMDKVVSNIKKSSKDFNKLVYIIYVNPSCDKPLKDNFTLIAQDRYPSGARVSYYKV